MLFFNGKYYGLYEITIPKDDWMFGMQGRSTEWVIGTELYSDTTLFKQTTTFEEVTSETYFSIEYEENNTDISTIVTSLNNAITATINAGSNYKTQLANYIDIDSAIDYYIFMCSIGDSDGIGKNYLLVTYDGIKYTFCAYDLDSVLGNHWTGVGYYNASQIRPTIETMTVHRIMKLIHDYDAELLKSRYKELR